MTMPKSGPHLTPDELKDARPGPESHTDVNAVVGGLLRDLAFVQALQPKMFGYRRAASAVLQLEVPLTDVFGGGGTRLPIPGVGPASTRVIREVLDTGESRTVELAVVASGRMAEVSERRRLRQHFLSRAEVVRILADPSYAGPGLGDFHGDLQMHSEWSDGQPTLAEIVDACLGHDYQYAAVTDHSHGLKIAGGVTMAEAQDQRRAIESLNNGLVSFRLIHGIEANIGADGELDLSAAEAAQFELVLAAPHSHLRKAYDQTPRLIAAVRNPAVRILAHPRGRITGSRAGIVADWEAIFSIAAEEGVAIEIDGDPARQDLDFTLAARALAHGCWFALDSDAHTVDQLSYAETALAHARLAGISTERIVNCWPVERLLAWMINRR
jgi:histidinol phosphatase-like PHP family hydrolase